LAKRTFDLVASAMGLLLLSPLFALIALWVKLDSSGPVFHRGQRVGRKFRVFEILKFRTMVADAPSRGGPITIGDDPRITRAGRLLRRTKLDELPQLINVLLGDMSLVGPRPEARCFVAMFRQDYDTILQVRPGITDLASLKYRNEAAILAQAENPEQEYVARVLPEKIRFAKQYVAGRSLRFDLMIIARTVLQLLGDCLRRK
jgi:lipopolysaccharide/colanic/teichoic acid biosynthesis glycosyltransferase